MWPLLRSTRIRGSSLPAGHRRLLFSEFRTQCPWYLLSSFVPGSIELYRGDRAALPAEVGIEVLIVSASPSDYTPTPTSTIGRLAQRGISVKALARAKAEDLRTDFSCWLSGIVPGAPFRRILCFEPASRREPPDVVGDIFRCLAALGLRVK